MFQKVAHGISHCTLNRIPSSSISCIAYIGRIGQFGHWHSTNGDIHLYLVRFYRSVFFILGFYREEISFSFFHTGNLTFTFRRFDILCNIYTLRFLFIGIIISRRKIRGRRPHCIPSSGKMLECHISGWDRVGWTNIVHVLYDFNIVYQPRIVVCPDLYIGQATPHTEIVLKRDFDRLPLVGNGAFLTRIVVATVLILQIKDKRVLRLGNRTCSESKYKVTIVQTHIGIRRLNPPLCLPICIVIIREYSANSSGLMNTSSFPLYTVRELHRNHCISCRKFTLGRRGFGSFGKSRKIFR